MSTPESIVVSLEKARALEKAGWPQEKPFLSYCNGKLAQYHRYGVGAPERELPEKLAAPTSEEILRKLPKEIGDCVLDVHYFPADGHGWRVCYAADMFDGPKMTHHTFSYDSATDALASMWIYLSKNNLLPKA